MFAASLLSRFMQKLGRIHYGTTKRVLKDLLVYLDYGILDREIERLGLISMCWVLEFVLGLQIKRLWQQLKQLLKLYGWGEFLKTLEKIKQDARTTLFCNKKSEIATRRNPIFHDCSKHMAIKYHFIRKAIEKGEIELKCCRAQEQLADSFTK